MNNPGDKQQIEIGIRLWSEGDLPLLERLMGDPAMTEHIGGPESAEKIRKRHQRYCQHSGPDKMFVIIAGSDMTPVGSVGYWEKEWQGQLVLETGWSVLPEFQGHNIATRAAGLVVQHARAHSKRRFIHAFPSVDNPPSNAICRKAGFSLLGEFDFEYPPGNLMRCNDWCLDLFDSDSG